MLLALFAIIGYCDNLVIANFAYSADCSHEFIRGSSQITFLTIKFRRYLRLQPKKYGINIFYKDDVLFLLISVRNSSAVSYELATPRFAVESARRTKRGLQYEKAVCSRGLPMGWAQ